MKQIMKHQKWLAIGAAVMSVVLIIFICLLLFLPRASGDDAVFAGRSNALATFNKDVYGVLLLGSDEGATNTNGGNHTDSLTYLAVNRRTGEVIALPIYRDAFIPISCKSGTSDNANRIYRDYGAECLKQSVSALLGLPVDYYLYTTSDAFVTILNDIGPVAITPDESFCSNFGNDDQEYCFESGVSQNMNGNELLAYARYRGNSSGERRAERHVPMIQGILNQCAADKRVCAGSVLVQMANGKVQSDIEVEAAIDLLRATKVESLGVVGGSNFEDEHGWHQRVDLDDLVKKVQIIRERMGI
ncbi:LCP family protein [Culicoidibacter larvae]|uniref:LytR family transcriptional regulator n=1 Tax=Culicoidibacter larvae TaxID=2579976 RepID=A0A5R8QC82_9FIRM|nr:LCP family protein [Culicoidibacter larvae]TLG73876.1 LytR family transcriptional regulator [Culicoidibacter larvae]